jgi:integrase
MATITGAFSRGAMFYWAIRADLVQANPFLTLPFSKRERHRDRFLRDNELGAIYAAAGHRPYPAGPMVQLLMLTAQRLDEVAGCVGPRSRPICPHG